jgi:hypothetical protein
MQLLDHGIVYNAQAQPKSRRFCAFTNTTILSDGRILVAFHSGSAKESPDENVIMRLSADEGKTWETVCDGLEPLVVQGKPGSWHHGRVTELVSGHLLGAFWWLDRSDPARPMINPETTGTLPNHIFVMESFDSGRTWLDRREVDTRPFESVALMGAPLKLANGDTPAPPSPSPASGQMRVAIVSESWKTYHDASQGRHHAILSISHDSARTFDAPIVVANDPSGTLLFWDQRLAVDPQTGRLIGMFWTHNRVARQDANVHIAWGTPDGKTWTDPTDAGFLGQIPRPLVLPGGRVLVTYIHRHYPPSLRAILSPDFGKTWDVQNELVFYEHAFAQPGMSAKREFADYYADMRVWSFGHAEPGMMPNGDVFVAFYAGDANSLSVRWARLGID